MLITATETTPLKFKLEQLSQLDKHQYLILDKKTKLDLEIIGEEEGHYVVKAYVYKEHIEAENFKIDFAATNPDAIPKDYHEVDWTNFLCPVSKYFTVGEVTNCDVNRIPTDNTIKQNIFTLAKELDKVREAWESAIIVTSWYRPPAINQAIGGASNSQHIYGKAADIKPAKGDLFKFQNWLDNGLWSNKALGYGAKKGFVHVDLRDSRIRWDY